MWSNKYVGIPYKDYGRDTSGIDCWGLARLVYKNEFNINLPSFTDSYTVGDRQALQELIARNKESWVQLDKPTEGCLVLFRILGNDSHIGIAVSDTHFLHARDGYDSSIEAFDGINWKSRIAGYFKYHEKADLLPVTALPHPLNTTRVVMGVQYGSTISQILEQVDAYANVSPELKKRVLVLLNSRVIPESEYSTTVVKHGDTLEYRALPGKDIGRLVLTLIVVYIAVNYGLDVGTALLPAGTTTATATFVGQTAITLVGTALVNAIAPIRPPASPGDPGSTERQLMISGGANQLNRYGTIPFVLGKTRITPPLGAQNFIRYGAEEYSGIVDNATKSYLDMLLVWGYGPLQIDEATLKIGEVSLIDYTVNPPKPNFEGLRYITLDRKTTEPADELVAFNSIYGRDREQKYSGIELVCEGLPPVTRRFFGSNEPWAPADTPGPWTEVAFSSPSDKISAALHFPQGLRAINVRDGGNLAAPVKITLEYKTQTGNWTSWGTYTIGGTLTNAVQEQVSDGYGTGYVNIPANYIASGAARKDAFTWVVNLDRGNLWGANDIISVRARRETGDNSEPNGDYRYSHTVILQDVTSTRNTTPTVDPKNAKIAKTALTLQATDQLNNQIEGINAVVQTWCLDWNGTAWVEAATSNPASLFRYVLESAANPQRVLPGDVSSKINLAQLQYWHDFCNQTRTDPETGATYKYEFNGIIASQRSVLEILRDICAAGKASPALQDGKWTVVIDEPRSTIVQHFSPHNSWGFESTKSLPKLPDALKIQYFDESKNYQESELIIPYAGKTVSTAELFETIQLPGVTNKYAAKDHARWHMAQAKLRPEVYTLNADIEYLVCNRGDRVKVSHDVPMWGLGSGRVKDRVTDAIFDLDELVPLSTSKSYTMRVRSKTGTSTALNVVTTFNVTNVVGVDNVVTLTLSNRHPLVVGNYIIPNITAFPELTGIQGEVTAVTEYTISYNITGVSIPSTAVTGTVSVKEGYYNRVLLSATATTDQIDAGDLFLFGENQNEAQDLLVISIEPAANKTARLTLVDYGVTNTYNIFTDYLALSSNVIFETQITLPPKLLIDSFGTKKPTITKLVSDETVMELIAPGVFAYKIKVSYYNASDLPRTTDYVEAQVDYTNAIDTIGTRNIRVPYSAGSIDITDVEELKEYKVRLRYLGKDGRMGEWTQYQNHVVVGKTSPPAQVGIASTVKDSQAGKIKLYWPANTEIDIAKYEVRDTTNGWGTSGFVYQGTESFVYITPPPAGSPKTYYIKAIDSSGNYSVNSTSIVVSVAAPAAPTSFAFDYFSTSKSSSIATLSWIAPTNYDFIIDHYEIQLQKPGNLNIINANTTQVTIDVDWTGSFPVQIYAVDILGNKSVALSGTIIKYPPGDASNITYTVIESKIVAEWTASAVTSLPIAGYEIRTSQTGWGDGNHVLRVPSNTADISKFITGSNTWYIKAFDTAGEYSTNSVSQQLTVSIPNAPTNVAVTYSDTNISGAQAAISWTASTVSTFRVAKYQVQITKYPGPTETIITSDTTSISVPVDWKTNANIVVRAIDVTDRVSNASTLLNSVKTAPSTPTGATVVAATTGGITISWNPATKGTLPIAGYELRLEPVNPGTPGFVYQGSASSVVLPKITTGTTTWYLWSYDTDGQYSASSATITFTTVAPNPVSNIRLNYNTSSNTSSTAIFKWDSPLASMFTVDKYEVSFEYTNPTNTTLTTTTYSTSWEIPANWVGNGTLSVKVYDIQGANSTTITFTAVKNLPNTPSVVTTAPKNGDLELDWEDNIITSLPVTQYELRDTDSNWGSPGFLWKGSSSSTRVTLPTGTGLRTWYLKAIDSDGKYCTTPRQIDYTVASPANPVVYPAEFSTTSLTNASVILTWDPVTPVFGLKGYEITYGGNTELVSTTLITLPADWVGDRIYTIKTVDLLNNKSTGSTITATKLAPLPVTEFRAQAIDNNILLYWGLPNRTTLPISHVSIRKGDVFATSTNIGNKDGTFTSISELVGGQFTYWISVVDTDGRESTPVSLGVNVSQPPDFIFNAEFISDFSGTKVNCIKEGPDSNSIVLPVNTTESFGSHFTSNGWDQPSDQIAAGYPVYIQPGVTSGYYEQVFDYGTVLGSSQITTSISGVNVYGTPKISYVTSVSLDGVTYTDYTGVSSIFAVNFRYVKVRITAVQEQTGDLYKINSLSIRLDAKQKSDSGTVDAISTDSLGTAVNFAQEFVDVTSIMLTPKGTTPLTAVYDYRDVVLYGSYSVTSNVATISVTDHQFVVGQQVRLFFTTGSADSAIYTITSVPNANTFTVAITTPNTSGSVSIYANSMRVYLFNSAGARVSGSVSWTARGY